MAMLDARNVGGKCGDLNGGRIGPLAPDDFKYTLFAREITKA